MKHINQSTIIIATGTLLLGLGLGMKFFGHSSHEQQDAHEHMVESVSEWTCSMHPQVRQNEFGQCPLCGMDLIPVESDDEGGEDVASIRMSPTAMQLAQVQTAFVQRELPIKVIRLEGKVQADERKIASLTSQTAGRIDQLLLNFTGEYVSKGQLIANVYSPELVTAQEELLTALQFKDNQPALFEASKKKLKYWKLSDKQINKILQNGKPITQFPVLSDVNGVVISKKVNVGDHIKQGDVLYEVANLSRLWVLFDVYEQDVPWVKVGSEIEFTLPSLPGESFSGQVSFIEPLINQKTRVAKARVVIANHANKLKPEMMASGELYSSMKGGKATLSVPKSAVMWTGKRSVVYVKYKDDRGVQFSMREIRLGAELGESYQVIEGLSEGEEIVVQGTFSVDAAAQLAGKPSMMSLVKEEKHSTDGNVMLNADLRINQSLKTQFTNVINSYMALKDYLVEDELDKAKENGLVMRVQMNEIDLSSFKGKALYEWSRYLTSIKSSLSQMNQESHIEAVRADFIILSEQMINLAKVVEPTVPTLYVQHCPMANDNQGANWLSYEKEIMNPYFGDKMLNCGIIKLKIE